MGDIFCLFHAFWSMHIDRRSATQCPLASVQIRLRKNERPQRVHICKCDTTWCHTENLRVILRRHCGERKFYFLTRCLDICSCVCSDQSVPNPNQVLIVPKPNQSVSTPLWQEIHLKNWTKTNVKSKLICCFAERNFGNICILFVWALKNSEWRSSLMITFISQNYKVHL